MSSSRSPLAADAVGSYQIVRELGSGATARVFEGEHRELGKRVAIKLLFPRSASCVRAGRLPAFATRTSSTSSTSAPASTASTW
ncbi:MAG: hypothetical protein MUF34_19695 [Polyangiaceae bacterium]|nr:hypothetical protein [Polyangiaceae bacterium]